MSFIVTFFILFIIINKNILKIRLLNIFFYKNIKVNNFLLENILFNIKLFFKHYFINIKIKY